ncbi:MAG: transcription termination factor NusA [Patescibacteria group bacterium]
MFDLKVINSVLEELEAERGIPKEKIIEAIAASLATAYKKEYGKKGQIIRATFDLNAGGVEFFQVKLVVDETRVRMEDEPEPVEGTEDMRVRFNPEHHILIADARRIKKGAELDEEIIFPLEVKSDFGRIAAQTAKQVIIQKLREAEKVSVLQEFGGRQGEVVMGTVQRIERGNIYVDLKRATGILPYEEQIPGERYGQGERVRAYLYAVEDSPRGVFLKLSRSHPKFLAKLFEFETPEIKNGMVEIRAIAREAGSRSKVAVVSKDPHIDPVGSMVGARGVRVSTVTSELRGEKIDIVEWSEDPKIFLSEAIQPAKVLEIEMDIENRHAILTVSEDQQSLAIGRGGQNVRLAGKLTGWRIDIRSAKGEELAHTEGGEEANLDKPGQSASDITGEILAKGEDVAEQHKDL